MTDFVAIAIVLGIIGVFLLLMTWAIRAVKAPRSRKGGFDAVYAIFYAFSTAFERAPQHINEAKSPERIKKSEAGDPPSKDGD